MTTTPRLEDRLIAWGVWGRRRRRSQREAGSIEGRWRPGDRGEYAVTTTAIIDANDCRLIESAWADLNVLREKAFLWLHYRQQYAQRRILFILADMPGPYLGPDDWVTAWNDAHMAIERALARGTRGAVITRIHVGVDIFPAMA